MCNERVRNIATIQNINVIEYSFNENGKWKHPNSNQHIAKIKYENKTKKCSKTKLK